MFSVEGKVAAVTGGYSGLGRQITEALLEAGADVAICARRVEKWHDSYEALESLGLPKPLRLEDWEKVLQTNLTGTFLCSQAAGRIMIANGRGSIINTSSVAGMYGSGPDVLNAIGYTTNKAGIIGFTKDLAMKWASHGIRANTLVPGWFNTHLTEKVIEANGEKIIRFIPMRRLGSPTDLKGAVIFLASDASSYMTGQITCVDCGLTTGR